MSRLSVLALAVLLAACATSPDGDTKLLQETLDDYGTTMRWGDIPQAIAFIDPDTLARQPVTSFDLERFRQVRIAGYREQPWTITGPGTARQVVEIELINRNTQTVRSMVDAQDWRWDAIAGRWWLVSGLPNIDSSH